MKWALFTSIVDQLAAFPENLAALFYLHICGEPLLHPQITDFIKYARQRGFKPILTTNATRLFADLAEKLTRSGLHKIEFSFEGIDAASYEAIRIGASFEVVSENIERFIEINNANGHPVATELIVVDLPQLDPNHIQAFAERMAFRFDHVLISGYFDWLGRVPTVNYPKTRYVGCSVLASDLNVLWDGRVVPCCQDVDGAMTLGDFTKQCFLEVLRTPEHRVLEDRLQAGHLAGLPCDHCVVPWAGRQNRHTKTTPRTIMPTLAAV